MSKQKAKEANSRFFEYTIINGELTYIAVFLLTEKRYMTYRSMTKGSPIISIIEQPFNDQENYILEGGVYGSWKDNEIKLLDLIDSLGLVTSDFFDYLNEDIGAWLLTNLKDDSLYKGLFPSLDSEEKQLTSLLEPSGLKISEFYEYLNSDLGEKLLLSLKKEDKKNKDEDQQKKQGKENE